MTNDIEAYASLDLSHESAAAQDLLRRIEQEARLNEIHLSDLYDTMPSGLTGSMRQWFTEHISPGRNKALGSVSNYLQSIDRTEHGDPVFELRDQQDLKRKAIERTREAIKHDRDANATDYERLESLQKEERDARRKYETLRNRHGREPQCWSKWMYMLVLLAIGLAELAINWESFNAIEYFTPAIATGTALVVGMALALSSHYTGMTLRQFRARFDNSNDDLDVYSGWKMLSLAGLTLSIALGAVYYGRIFYFQQLVMDSWGAGSDASMLKVVGGSMISNLLVWLVGVLFAYMAHDPDPDFPGVKDRFIKLTADREASAKTIEKRLARVKEKIEATYQKERVALANQVKSLGGISEQREADKMIAKIKAQDDCVKGLLARYQSQLLAATEPTTVFVQKDPLFGTPQQLSPREYEQNEMVMNYV